MVRNKAVYVALALNSGGEREVQGLWIEQTEGAKFWLKSPPSRKRGVFPRPSARCSRKRRCIPASFI
jgi:hypothetical protein